MSLDSYQYVGADRLPRGLELERKPDLRPSWENDTLGIPESLACVIDHVGDPFAAFQADVEQVEHLEEGRELAASTDPE